MSGQQKHAATCVSPDRARASAAQRLQLAPVERHDLEAAVENARAWLATPQG